MAGDLDYEKKSSMVITILAEDNLGLNVTLNVSVSVRDANDAPSVITQLLSIS